MPQGIKSIAREAINGAPAKAVDTGDVAYRILIPAAGLVQDPELKQLVDEPWAVTWTGPEGHFVGYPLRGGELYNMIICVSVKSTLHGKSLSESDWLVTADNEELRIRFNGWCSPVQKLCALAGQVSSMSDPELSGQHRIRYHFSNGRCVTCNHCLGGFIRVEKPSCSVTHAIRCEEENSNYQSRF